MRIGSNHVRAIPMEMEALIRSGHAMKEIEEADIAFFTLFNSMQDAALKFMLLESDSPSLVWLGGASATTFARKHQVKSLIYSLTS